MTSPSSVCPVEGTPDFRQCRKCEACVIEEAWSRPIPPPSQGRDFWRALVAYVRQLWPRKTV